MAMVPRSISRNVAISLRLKYAAWLIPRVNQQEGEDKKSLVGKNYFASFMS